MRTARALTESPSMLCAGGVPGPGGWVGAPGECLLWGVSQHALRQTPLC